MDRLLYDNDYYKPELSENYLEHHGIDGQKWGVRHGPPYPLGSGGGKGSIKQRSVKKRKVSKLSKKKKVDRYKSNEKALKDRDLAYISSHMHQFSTQEMNDLMNRIGTEQRMSKMYSDQKNATKNKVKKILTSKPVKTAAAISVVAFATAGTAAYAKYKGLRGPGPAVNRSELAKEAVKAGFKAIPKLAGEAAKKAVKKAARGG